jgi:undecaprenyl-diphosphatase
LVLGVLQGLTEFLPVSSSGHLVLAQSILGEDFEFETMKVAFDLVLHVGTLLPVLYFYRRDLVRILRSFVPGRAGDEAAESHGVIGWLRADDARWLAVCVVVGTLPTALMGALLKDRFERLFDSPFAVSCALIVTGGLLFSTRFFGQGDRRRRGLGVGVALAVGVAQGMAITPGVSRSGATIAVALLLGLDRDLAARLSFLLSIPAIIGASILVAKDGFLIPPGTSVALLVGFASSMLVGYAALVLLVTLVRRGGLHHFAWYLWPAGLLGLILTT